MATKNAKMFKERFQEIFREKKKLFDTDDSRRNSSDPSDDTIAQLILAEIVPTRGIIEMVESNLSRSRYSSDTNIDDVLLKQYPERARVIRSKLKSESKGIRELNAKNLAALDKLFNELQDKVLFNGLDPLEAIKQLQAFPGK